jgi:hypothetical protein
MKKGERKGRGIPENALGEGHDCKMQIGMQQPLECEKCRSMLHFAGGLLEMVLTDQGQCITSMMGRCNRNSKTELMNHRGILVSNEVIINLSRAAEQHLHSQNASLVSTASLYSIPITNG